MNLDLKSLIDKLNPTCRKALEGAAQLCVTQTHYNVEVEHLLARLLEEPDSDLQRVLRYYEVQSEDVTRELQQAIDGFKRGNSRPPAMSSHILTLVQESWLVSSLQFGQGLIRSGALLLALLDNESLLGLLVDASPALLKIPRERLREDLREIARTSGEETESGGKQVAAAERGEGPSFDGDANTPSLDLYTVDLLEEAKAGKIDPIRGRDAEIRQIEDILTRRRQNNPILSGEAGGGKTAVVEGFALRIAAGDVPPALQKISLRTLDLGLLQAGAGVKGEFENRLKSVIDEVKSSPRPIILFIDEAHTLIGAGNQSGAGDAANMLKPALARGELRTIAATTWGEYKKYFEKDPALARRFQVVQVEEPTEAVAAEMLRGVVGTMEAHHGVHVLDEAVRDAVALSHRYISGRQLPDKASSVLDTACARVAIGQTGTPPSVEDARRQIERIEQEIEILEREAATGSQHDDRLTALGRELQTARDHLLEQESLWEKELEVVKRIKEQEGRLEEEAASAGEEGEDNDKRLVLVVMQGELSKLKRQLHSLQGDEPMVPTNVDSRVIASVISGWTGIPLGKMLTDEIDKVLDLESAIRDRIIGQPQAIEAICKRIKTSRADLVDPGKPAGVFLLAGPSGVGKTETAVTLSDLLYGGERNMVTINMSEYQEAHTVSSLKGAPPGYVGYGTGGVLTEAVRRNAYSVVLLDEVEKAHPDVMELFYQVFDKGILEDSEGVPVDFRNTMIILTSNVGTNAIIRAAEDPAISSEPERLHQVLRDELLQYFKPAFLGRMVIIPYLPLGETEIREIVTLKMDGLRRRVRENHRAELTYDDTLVDAIAARCTETESGARNIDHILTHTLLPGMSARVLERMARQEPFSSLSIGLDPDGAFDYRFEDDIPAPGPTAPDEPTLSNGSGTSGAVGGSSDSAGEP